MRAAAIVLLFLGAALAGPGCAGGRASLRFDSNTFPATFEPRYLTGVYDSDDPNSAHIFLTDIDRLGRPGLSGEGMTGSVVYIHMFLLPKAGRTPIEFSAANTTIKHAVIADGAFGVYGGGGFLLPEGPPGGSIFSGRIQGATLRPLSFTDAFGDRLGWNEMSGTVAVRYDPERAQEIGRWMRALIEDPRLSPASADAATPPSGAGEPGEE